MSGNVFRLLLTYYENTSALLGYGVLNHKHCENCHGIMPRTAEQCLAHLSYVFWSQSGGQAKRRLKEGTKKRLPSAKSQLFSTSVWCGKNERAAARGSSWAGAGRWDGNNTSIWVRFLQASRTDLWQLPTHNVIQALGQTPSWLWHIKKIDRKGEKKSFLHLHDSGITEAAHMSYDRLQNWCVHSSSCRKDNKTAGWAN